MNDDFGPSRKRRRISSLSDSDSSMELRPRRRAIPRVTSDADSDSSGSVIVVRPRRPTRIPSDMEGSRESDHGFEGSSSSSSSQSEDQNSDVESANVSTARVQDTGVDSDSSDGQSDKCPICLVRLLNQEVGTPGSCHHMFCVDCILEWAKNMNTCPVDRKEFHIIYVRKNVNGSIYKEIPVEPPNPEQDVDIVEDPTFCEVCGLGDREDRMLLCDGCDLGYHLECLDPPLADIPAGSWYCYDCDPERRIDSEAHPVGLRPLLDEFLEGPRHAVLRLRLSLVIQDIMRALHHD